MIDYWLPPGAAPPVRLEIRDARGTVVRRFDSADPTPAIPAERYFAERWVRPATPLACALKIPLAPA